MIEFTHTVKDPNGIHARPAGLLVKEASQYQSEITLHKEERTANMKRLFALMSLTVKGGETVKVTVSGSDEERAAQEMKAYLEKNL